MQKILLIDDEKRMLDLLELFLEPHGFSCIKVDTGEKGLEIVKDGIVDLVLLDVMMPDLDGWAVCKKIRELSTVPVIMLTARTDKEDIVKGLEFGADDYITKPFDERELVARVNALLRRTSNDDEENSHTVHGDFILNRDAYSLQYKNAEVQLTLKEFYIIEALITHPKRTFTREQLLRTAWDYNTFTDIRTVDSHIRNLREKLRVAGFPIHEFLLTVWGIGYKWN
ncbi:response regulator transcription factor [Sporosarcina oncorhynchi]|uniref:Response regulator transcription factor n=1 Tax=Sporosarcina oncorhynchi TaxID=3056444 RepID=A0ABZ0L218_9BACL|nr:response regulator transcription factor [Sporosarcina sp. T2O-4]WOV86505.1 response regulator transcription factor [Sporosarcina sp. T2O-4]